jgi:outer membrane protein
MLLRRALLLSLLLAPAATSASAQDRAPRRQDNVQWSVGGGVIASPRPYEGVDMKIFPVPVVGLRAGAFFFESVRMGVRVANLEHFKADVIAQARLEGYDEDDSDALEGMDDRRMTADAGMRLTGKWRHVEAELMALADVLSRHEGQEVGVGVGFPIRTGRGERWTITPGVGARWQSEDLVDYYFGVEPTEAKVGRPAYEAEETVNLRAEVKVRHVFPGRRWSFLGQVTHEWLGDEIQDSPIVDDETTLGGYIAFVRTFR